MATSTIIAYNQTESPVFFKRTGLTVPASSSLILTDFAFIEEIKEDESIYSSILSNQILLGFGEGQQTKGESLKFFNIVTQEVIPPVRALADSDVASLSGTTTIDGISLAVDDRVLLTAQSTPSENGIWVVKSGAWVRPDDFDVDQSASGALVTIQNEVGSTYGGQIWICNSVSGSDIIGIDALIFQVSSSASSGISENQHENINTLAHEVIKNSYDELIYTGTRITNIITWTSAAKTLKIRETQLTYTGSKVTQTVDIQYNGAGNEDYRIIEIISYTGNDISNITRTRI